MRGLWVGVVAAALVASVASGAAAQTLPDGEQLYKQQCAMCHDAGLAGAPARAVISQRSHQAIIDTLTSGLMKVQASGLKPEEIAALATYLALEKPALANPQQPTATPAAANPPSR